MTPGVEKKYNKAKNVFIQQINRVEFLTKWIDDIFKLMGRKEDIMLGLNPDCWETDDDLNEAYARLCAAGEILYGYGNSLVNGTGTDEEVTEHPL